MPSRPSLHLRIGLDLDNTLISYDRLFFDAAVERRFVPLDFVGTKRDIRDYVRLLPGGEVEWQRLQAHVYGPAIAAAHAADGALDFIRLARRRGAEVAIVSHKSTFSNLGASPVNLREAARQWLRDNGMLGADAVPEENLYFEDTRAEKIARIVSLRCTHFIDDLEEVFNDPSFPAAVERLLLATSTTVPAGPYMTYHSFREIADALIAD
jgi:hypothetical protein